MMPAKTLGKYLQHLARHLAVHLFSLGTRPIRSRSGTLQNPKITSASSKKHALISSDMMCCYMISRLKEFRHCFNWTRFWSSQGHPSFWPVGPLLLFNLPRRPAAWTNSRLEFIGPKMTTSTWKSTEKHPQQVWFEICFGEKSPKSKGFEHGGSLYSSPTSKHPRFLQGSLLPPPRSWWLHAPGRHPPVIVSKYQSYTMTPMTQEPGTTATNNHNNHNHNNNHHDHDDEKTTTTTNSRMTRRWGTTITIMLDWRNWFHERQYAVGTAI